MTGRRRRSMPAVAAVAILAGAAVSACGGGGDDATPASDAPTTPTVAESVSETSSPPSTESTETSTTATTTTVAEVESPLASVGVAAIEWTAESESAGDRPTLSWTAAPGAVEYRLIVTDVGSGAPIWAWQGTDVSVALGAGLIDGQEGPRLAAPALVDVFALAADGTIVAASGPQPISP